MIIDNISIDNKNKIFNNLEKYLTNKYDKGFVGYLNCGRYTIRLINYSEEYNHYIEELLPYVLVDDAKHYDATLVVWKDENLYKLPTELIDDYNPDIVELKKKQEEGNRDVPDLFVYDKSYSGAKPIIQLTSKDKIFMAQDCSKNIFYHAIESLNPEYFAKEKYLFVQQLANILRTPETSIVHSGLIGLNNIGGMLCSKGGNGKTSLGVAALFDGFDYVSDDYMFVESDKSKLYASPIYSSVTLSDDMYNKYFEKSGKLKFLFDGVPSNRKVFSVENFHDKFQKKYPVEFCLFPNLVPDENPSIELCSKEKKGQAIIQLIFSTVFQLHDYNDKILVKKIFDWVKDLDFYKINLTKDIYKNTQCLRNFILNYQKSKIAVPVEKMIMDISDEATGILDTETCNIYIMNELATKIYQNFRAGVDKDSIISSILKLTDNQINLSAEINSFAYQLKQKNLLDKAIYLNIMPDFDLDIIQKNSAQIWFAEFDGTNITELIRQVPFKFQM